MVGPLLRLHISLRSINKHGHHMQFLFLIASDGKSSHCLWQAEGDLKSYYGWSVSTVPCHPVALCICKWNRPQAQLYLYENI
jgi:hypothetical protein